MAIPNTTVGNVTGTGAALNVSVGYTPDYVLATNVSDGSKLEWFKGMTAGHAVKTVAAGTRSIITSGGISPYTGSSTAGAGFTIGADAQVNVNTQVIRYYATSNGPGQ